MKVLIVSSVGGHLSEVMHLSPLFSGHEVILVVNDHVALPNFPFSKVYRIAHAERNHLVFKNLAESARILLHELPDMILSAGAGPAVPMALVGRFLAGAQIVFLESAAAVSKPSLTGRLLYPISHQFFYQWPQLKRFFPRGQHVRVMFG